MKKLFAIMAVMVMCCQTVLMAQRQPNKMDRIVQSVSAHTQGKMKLSSDQLEKATMIIYHCDNGSVPPRYHYGCYVKVSKNNINVKVCHGYDGDVAYDKNHAISSSEYKRFLSRLLNQGISKRPNPDPIPDGAGASDITVKMNQKVLFEGDEFFDLTIAKGKLLDSFLTLLPADMKRVALNPEGMINE